MIPEKNATILKSTVFTRGTYFFPEGIKIRGKDITLDGNGSFLLGSLFTGYGIDVSNAENITLRNFVIQNFYHGIHAYGIKNLVIENCVISSTNEMPSNTRFLNIWVTEENSYGAGIHLSNIEGGKISGNNLSHQMNGLSMYSCKQIVVANNIANYCSGWGFQLNSSNHCLFENNYADYCCRYEPRGIRKGHMGADAAGFLIINGSCSNTFKNNYTRLGGDGFFLAGLTPEYKLTPCNNNLFESNDASYSPNNAFEAVFSAGNIFRDNVANYSNYGFWLGFSKDNIIESNQIVGNRQAGIAVENGVNFTVSGNTISNNQHGILLWSKSVPQFETVLPLNNTSRQWKITHNLFTRNNKAIRIAANQDHGIRPLTSSGMAGYESPNPENHIVQNNIFEDNREVLEEIDTVNTTMDQNEFK